MAFRDGPFEKLKVPLTLSAAAAVIVAVIAAVVLLLGDRRETMGPEGYTASKAGFDVAAEPAGVALSTPGRGIRGIGDFIGGYFGAVSENRRLRRENQELRAWRDQAIALSNLNARYEALLGLRTEPAVPTVAARAVIDSRGPFSNARILDTGSSKGVRVGNPVISQDGLVGRVVGTTPGVSRMILLTDVASRTPVLVERSGARALLVGDASDNPRLGYLRGEDAVREGDRILTSGDGGGLPRGVPVGVAAKGLDGAWRVKLFSDRTPIDIVKVLLFQSFTQLADPNALNAAPLSGLASAPPPTPEVAAAVTDAANRRLAAEQAAQRQREEQAVRLRLEAEAHAQAAAPPPAAPRPAPAAPAPAGVP